jgi:hypothetical protein
MDWFSEQQMAGGVVAYSIILWVPALLYSGSLWLVIWASKAVVKHLRG